MFKVIECLQNKKHGVLESPTGTGKTLSLLCSTLSWLGVKKAQLQAQSISGAINKSDFGGEFCQKLNDNLNNAAGISLSLEQNNLNFGWTMPKIIYASRTHSQLSQAMQELKRTAYSHVKVSVIGSRDQMCIHPEISKEKNSANKIHMCQIKVRGRTCIYFNNVESRKDDPLFKTEICDIEDLVKIGKKSKCCPYFLAKELKQSADITFMPYNYLLDPKTRKSQSIDIQNHVILLDEAHNVEKTCEEAASLQISSTDIAVCIDGITAVMQDFAEEKSDDIDFNNSPKDFTPEDLCTIKSTLLTFEKRVDEISLKMGEEGVTFPGSYVFKLFESDELSNGKDRLFIDKIDKIVIYLTTTNAHSFLRRGNALQKFSDFLKIVFNGGSTASNVKHRARVDKSYKVYVQHEEKKKTSKNDGWESKKNVFKVDGKLINYWCFSPGFGMKQIVELGVHSVILTSGTLSPLKPFISELGIPIDVQLENPHIVTSSQVCAGVLSQGPDNHPLNSSFNTRNDPKYISSLGRTIYNFSCLIPDGLLIFFPSYPIMNKCRDDWQTMGLWTTISEKKPIFVEPQSKEGFINVMNEFYKKIQDPNLRGAIFMAVCRGKVSEGLDFANANGRAVIITGLPFPPLKDPRVILKQKYLDEIRINDKNGLSGQQWYQLEASRAVNQAIGRIIRHKDDYGAIILCDLRFSNASFRNQLSVWLQPLLRNFSNYGMVTKELRLFFKNAEASLPQTINKIYCDLSLPSVAANFDSNTRNLGTSSLSNQSYRNQGNDICDFESYKSTDLGGELKVYKKKSDFSEVSKIKPKSFINFGVCKTQGSWSTSDAGNKKESLNEPAAKKRKLKVQAVDINFSTDSLSAGSSRGGENQIGVKDQFETGLKKELGKTYLKKVKKALNESDYKLFAVMIQNYTKNADFDQLLETLKKIFPAEDNLQDLFIGFSTFLKKQHVAAFDIHVNCMKN
ncbi:regulator of telomere elongation helicase 1 homolog isoform X2 [Aphidius gifuensis]|nr:regulator of telomere elongation helicase 1 homolog isoform X2 [Aphidius gifuensis]